MKNKETIVLSSITQKGGTGKTLITANLSLILSDMGYSVLAIDSDSQGTLSSLCNVLPKEYSPDNSNDILGLQDLYKLALECEEKGTDIPFSEIKKAILKPMYTKLNFRKGGEYIIKKFGFDLIPTDIGLIAYERIIGKYGVSGDISLRKIISAIKEKKIYDYILIDCPPALSSISFCSIVAADFILAPIQLEVSALRGTRNLVQVVAGVQEFLWNDYREVHHGVLGLVKNEYVERYKIQQDFDSVVNDFFPIKAFKSSIPKKTSCDSAHRIGWLFSQYDKQAYSAFEKLAKEIIKEIDKRIDEKEPVIVKELGQKATKELWGNKPKKKEKKIKKDGSDNRLSKKAKLSKKPLK